ncbi:MAG: Ig-like domain-containing protein [Lachnospiraceae bacterium]|nr:Ig-like domain-containing protein [Lachnospiraceae bacterium]
MKRKIAMILCLSMLLGDFAPALQAYGYDSEIAADAVEEGEEAVLTEEEEPLLEAEEQPEAEEKEEAEEEPGAPVDPDKEAVSENDVLTGDDTESASDDEAEVSDNETKEETEDPDGKKTENPIILRNGEPVNKLILFVSGNCTLSVLTEEDVDELDISWKSSSSKIVKVNYSGKAVGVKPGTATITATQKGGKSVSIPVEVKALPTVKTLKIADTGGKSFDYPSVSEGSVKVRSMDITLDAAVCDVLEEELTPSANMSYYVNTDGSTAQVKLIKLALKENHNKKHQAILVADFAISSPGIVQANVTIGNKTASENIIINQNSSGLDPDTPVWVGGQPASGWVGEKIYSSEYVGAAPYRSTFSNRDCLLGTEAISGKEAISYFIKHVYREKADVEVGTWIKTKAWIYPGALFYADPETHKPSWGFFTYKGKVYYTVSGNCGLVRSRENNFTDMSLRDEYLLSVSGEVLTGTILFDEENTLTTDRTKAKELYYGDPDDNGRLKKEVWAPLGKSYTYIGSKICRTLGREEGLQKYNGKWYFMYKDERASGWVWLDDKGKKTTERSKAVTFYYALPETGELIEGEFTVAGKKYWQSIDDENLWWDGYVGKYGKGVPHGAVSSNLLVNVRGLDDPLWRYVDENGAFLNNKLVDRDIRANDELTYHGVWVDQSTDDGLYYGVRLVKGSMVLFNPGIVAYDSEINDRVHLLDETLQNSYFCYMDKKGIVDMDIPDKEKTRKKLYIKNITDDRTGRKSFALYIDEAGRNVPTNALVVVDGSAWYYDPDGKIVKGLITASSNNISSWVYADKTTGELQKNKMISVDGQRYLLDERGFVITRAMTEKKYGLVNMEVDGEDSYFLVSTKGVLLSGFKTVHNRKRYFFPGTYRMATGIFVYKGQYYFARSMDTEEGVVGGKAKGLAETEEGYAWVNKDGTLKQGWIHLNTDDPDDDSKISSVKKAKWSGYFLGSSFLSEEETLYKIGSKWYHFDGDGRMTRGLASLSLNCAYDLDTGRSSLKVSGNFCFANNGRMLTGWSKVNGVKYYFASSDMSGYDPEGKLCYFAKGQRVENAKVTISGKLWSFDAKGMGRKLSSGRVKNADKSFSYVDTVTGENSCGVVRRTGNKWYFYGADGKATATAPIGAFRTLSGTVVYPVFAKKGNLIGVKTAGGLDLTSTLITVNGEYLGLDAKGKPASGVQEGMKDGKPVLVFITKNGTRLKAASGLEIIKSGKDYYLCDTEGYLRTSGSWLNHSADDMTALVELDLKDLVLIRLNGTERKKIRAAEAANEKVMLAVGSDGKLRRSTSLYNGSVKYRTNAYGMVIRGAVTRSGKKYYAGAELGVAVGDVTTLEAVELGSGTVMELSFAVKQDGEISSVKDSEGKAVSGVFTLAESELTICLKDGKIKSGTVKVNHGGIKTKLFFDEDMPVMIGLKTDVM